MARHYPDFLTAYLKYVDKTESPASYHIWTCLSIMGAAMQRRTYLQWGMKTFYPNLYVVLVGPSGCRKGTAMTIGKDLIKNVNGILVTSESVTREALIRDMREGVNQYVDPTDGQLRYHSSISVFSEELSVFLGQQNIKFLADLTDWFDCPDDWTYRTKGSGTDKIVGICPNILGATAPDWLKSILPSEAFGGGFTSRIIFVVEEEKRQLVSNPHIAPEVMAMREGLINDLQQMALMAGPFLFQTETMEFYEDWYIKQSKKPAIRDPLFAGYCERRATHLLKLSMVVSASRSNSRIIYRDDLERALLLLEAIEPKMPRTFLGMGKAKYSEMTALIYDYVKRHGKASSSELLNKFHLDLDEYSMKIICGTLTARRVISTTYSTGTGEYYYNFNGGE